MKPTETDRKRKSQDWMLRNGSLEERPVSAKSTGSGFSLLLKNLVLLTTGGLAGLGLLFLVSIGRTGSQFFDQLQD